jgi:hypothetical protein
MAYDITVGSVQTATAPEDLAQSLLVAKGSIETLLRDWQRLDERNRLQLLSVALLSIHQSAFALKRLGEGLVAAGQASGGETEPEIFRLPE